MSYAFRIPFASPNAGLLNDGALRGQISRPTSETDADSKTAARDVLTADGYAWDSEA